MTQPNAPTGTRNTGLGCSLEAVLAAIALVVIAALAIFLLFREPSTVETAKAQLQIERAEAWQPWTVVLGIAWRVVAIGIGLTLLLGLAATVRAGVHKLDLAARLIHPDRETGQFPAVKVRRGEALVDLNRSPDGKVMTGVVGGKAALLLVLFFRYLLGKDISELTEQPAILITPPDTSAAQLQITTQAQAAQALAAASRGMSPQQAIQAVQALPMRPVDRSLPPLLLEETQPREVQLLLEAGRRQWQRPGDEVVDAL
jgi:hypothetical protein